MLDGSVGSPTSTDEFPTYYGMFGLEHQLERPLIQATIELGWWGGGGGGASCQTP